MPRTEGLTPEQQRFVDEYLVDLNATHAYRRAFPGATYRTANKEGPKLRVKPGIREEIDTAITARAERTQITADRVLEASARIAFADPLELTDDDGRPRPMRQVPPELRAALAGVKVRTGRIRRHTCTASKTALSAPTATTRLTSRPRRRTWNLWAKT